MRTCGIYIYLRIVFFAGAKFGIFTLTPPYTFLTLHFLQGRLPCLSEDLFQTTVAQVHAEPNNNRRDERNVFSFTANETQLNDTRFATEPLFVNPRQPPSKAVKAKAPAKQPLPGIGEGREEVWEAGKAKPPAKDARRRETFVVNKEKDHRKTFVLKKHADPPPPELSESGQSEKSTKSSASGKSHSRKVRDKPEATPEYDPVFRAPKTPPKKARSRDKKPTVKQAEKQKGLLKESKLPKAVSSHRPVTPINSADKGMEKNAGNEAVVQPVERESSAPPSRGEKMTTKREPSSAQNANEKASGPPNGRTSAASSRTSCVSVDAPEHEGDERQTRSRRRKPVCYAEPNLHK